MPSGAFDGPLFVFGSARSGTTYAYRLVGSLPGVKIRYETTIIRTGFEIFEREDVWRDRSTFEDFLNRLRKTEADAGYDPTALTRRPASFYDRLYADFQRHRSFADFCGDLFRADVDAGVIWGNKLVNAAELQLLQRIFPSARFVLIVRDVRSVAYSAKQFFGADYVFSALAWAEAVRIVRTFEAKPARQPVMVFRYEDVVNDPRSTLERIAAFIDQGAPTDFTQADKAHGDSAAKWRDGMTTAEIRVVEEVSYAEMKQFDYEPEHASGAKPASRRRLAKSFFSHFLGRWKRSRGRLMGLSRLKAAFRRYYRLNKTRST
jgi:hypothetical protein